MAAKETIQSNRNLDFNWFAAYKYVMRCSQFYRVILGMEVFFFFKFYFGFHTHSHTSLPIHERTSVLRLPFSVRKPFFGQLTTYFSSYLTIHCVCVCCKLCYFIFFRAKTLTCVLMRKIYVQCPTQCYLRHVKWKIKMGSRTLIMWPKKVE